MSEAQLVWIFITLFLCYYLWDKYLLAEINKRQNLKAVYEKVKVPTFKFMDWLVPIAAVALFAFAIFMLIIISI